MELTMRSVWHCGGCRYVASARSWRAVMAARRDHEDYIQAQRKAAR